MSRDQIIGMRKLEQWPNNGGLVMLTRAVIRAGPGGPTGDKNNEVRPSQAAQIAARDTRGVKVRCSRFRNFETRTSDRAFRARLAPRSVALADCFSILLIVQDDTKEGAVHVDATVVLQEAQLPELIHEETYP